jgi:hypothetical protein
MGELENENPEDFYNPRDLEIAEEGLDRIPQSSENTADSARGGAKSGALSPASADDPRLAHLISVWPKLSEAARTAILRAAQLDRNP